MKTQPKTYFVLFSVISVLFLLLYLIDKTQTNHLAMFFANFTFAAYFFKKSKKNEVKSHETTILKNCTSHLFLL